MSHRLILPSLALLLSFGAFADQPAQADLSAPEIAACMRGNLPSQLAVEDFVLSSKSANGAEEVVSGQIYYSRKKSAEGLGPARAMMRLENPAPLRNAAYLLIETDDYMRDGVFVFLPALNRVRRVAGTLADGQLFGTDISYYDFKQIRSAFADMGPTLLHATQEREHKTYHLRLHPGSAENAPYQHVDATIDARSCLPLRVEMYEHGRLVKVLSVSREAIRRDQTRWYPAEFSVHDLIRNSHTTLRTTGFDTQTELPDKLFSPSSFYRVF